MAFETVSKRAKRLVNHLFQLQSEDLELTGPFCIAIKHHLRSSKHCRAVEVLARADTEFTLQAFRGDVDKFILSQLEAQKLTSQDPALPIVINPLVVFVLSCIPPLLTKQNSVPTLFHWQAVDTHRTFCIFAFVSASEIMPSPVYTIQELLGLRDLGVPVSLPEVPQKGNAYVSSANSSVRHDNRSFGRFTKHRPHIPSQMVMLRSRDEPSTTTDDVMFVRQEPHRGPVSVTHAHSLNSNSGPSSAIPSGVGSATAGGPVEMEWRYRGRTESEATSAAEPLSAPTGLSAQQSEGFQRFYKAVVSPTHVRVTAGGRIVPNTRGTSPMSKRPKEKPEDESAAQNSSVQAAQPRERQQSESSFPGLKPPAMPMFAFPPHQFYPAFPGSIASMPMMPLPMGLGLPAGFQFPTHPAMHSTSVHAPSVSVSGLSGAGMSGAPQTVANPTAKENQFGRQRSEASEPEAVISEKPDEASKRAPSDQLEQTKSFSVNGQAMYPFATPAMPHPQAHPSGPHPQFFPTGFVGHSGFPMPPFPGHMMMPPPAPMNHMLAPSMNYGATPTMQVPPPGFHPGVTQAHLAGMGRQPSSSTQQPPTAPPISSIRPSEISRKQIEMLRSSLKYHTDQLLYNKHQIDEKEMERTIEMLQSQIDRFEALNHSQLLFEEAHYPKRESKASEATQHPKHSEQRRQQTGSFSQSSFRHVSRNAKRTDSNRHKPISRQKETCFYLDPVEPFSQVIDPVKKSTLPSGAALAPPFRPRDSTVSEKPAETHGEAKVSPTATSFNHEVTQTRTYDVNAALGMNRRQNVSSSSTDKSSDFGDPYLVGKLPPHVDVHNARSSDYVYDRELTQDEIRSRFLFWGKAPAFARRGLPKFDGKDFYPSSPSPSKDDSCHGTPPSVHVSRQIPVGDPSVDFNIGTPRSKEPISFKSNASGKQTTSFTISRPKPVKVTLRRPGPEDLNKHQQSNCQAVKPSSGANTSEVRGKYTGESTSASQAMLRSNIQTVNEWLPNQAASATDQGIHPSCSARYDRFSAVAFSPGSTAFRVPGQPSPTISDDSNVFLTPASKKVGENRPPPDSVGAASLEQQFQAMISLEAKHDASLPVHWSAR